MEEKKKKFVISYKNEPVKMPFFQTITVYLLYLRFPADTTLKIVTWTILWLIVIIMWIGAFYSALNETQIDIFTAEEKDDIRKHS